MDPMSHAPRFALDTMLIKLGKYLRCLGYDAQWDAELGTRDLILRANAEDRLFLTRNRRIERHYPLPLRMLVLEPDDPVLQLATLVRQCGLDVRATLFSRCIRCNVELEALPDREAARGRVPEGVFLKYRDFYRCPSCATLFWRGTHVENTCRKLGIEPPEDAL